MNENFKNQEAILIKEKKSDDLSIAAKDKEGNIYGTKPEQSSDFIKIDQHGNLLGNFFENFIRQVKDPTHFEFFRVPADQVKEVFGKLQEALKSPDSPENKEFIDMHRINPEDFQKKQAQEQKSEKDYAIDPNFVKWDKLENYGIKLEMLEKTGNLEKLLNYGKTDLLTVTMKIGDDAVRSDARFSLRRQEDGSFVPATHLIRKEPELERPYFGVKFTEEDKQNLLKTGNLGRIVDAEFRQGEKNPILLSVDKLTNELVPFRTKWMRVPESIKGVQLNTQQQKDLSEGKAVYLENMTSKQGKSFDANVQFNADKRSFEFIFDNNRQNQQHSQSSHMSQDVQKTFRGKALSEDQRDSLREGKTVQVTGLVDKKGKEYSGYITLNKETEKTDFMFPKDYKDAVANGKATPDDRHKTQVAVNSEGKTNEATKNVKSSLEKGQTQPTEKQAEKKSKSMKMPF